MFRQSLPNILRRSSIIRLFISMLLCTFVYRLLPSFTKVTIEQKLISEPLPFPWYTQPHPNVASLLLHESINVSLTTTERQKLSNDMVELAKHTLLTRFDHIKGIPGSIMNTDVKATSFRALVDCWTAGEWVLTSKPEYVMPHFQTSDYGVCDRKYKKHHPPGSLRPAVRYVWKSPCDSQINVDKERWCQVLRGRHILLVGDLVQYQLHDVLMDSLRDGSAICFGEMNCRDHSLCKSPKADIRYIRNDRLTTARSINLKKGQPKANIIEYPFATPGDLKKYKIVILNRSPVAESDQEFIQSLIKTIETIRNIKPDILLIYRSSGIGHPFCDDATKPLEEKLTDHQMKHLPFGWSEQRRRNAIARVIVEAAGGVFVDLAAMTDLRPDGHIGGNDCLRYCIPGPLTSWAEVLYKIFLGLEGSTYPEYE